MILWLLACAAPDIAIVVRDGPLSGTVPVSVNADVDRIALTVAGDTLVNGPGPSVEVAWDTTTVEDGPQVLRAFAFRGGTAYEAELEVEVSQLAGDTAAPNVQFVLPTADQTVDRDRVDVVFTVTDSSPLASVTLYEGGTVLAEMPTEGPWELGLTDLMSGLHTFTAEAVDAAGNLGAAERTFVVSDQGSVSCSITRPEEGATVSGALTVAVAASSDAGVRRLQVFADGVEIGTDNASPWEVAWDTTALDGTVEVRALVTDADAYTCEDTVSVTIGETTEPFLVDITSPADGATISGAAYRVRARVGGGNGVASVSLFVDDALADTITVDPWEFAVDTTALPNGEHVLRVDGTERVTGTVLSDSITVTVAN